MITTMPLYCSLDPRKKHAVVHETAFQEGALRVALRPLWLPHDWQAARNWLLDEFARGIMPINRLSEDHLLETFSVMLQCDFAQPFLGLLNNNPGFIIEISDGVKQGSLLEGSAHVFEEGDQLIRLLLSPPVIAMRTLGEYALISSIDYFFSYLQVKRIIWELHEKDKHYIFLAKQLGFDEYSAYDWPGMRSYIYSRENYSRFMSTRQ
jgi:hypothetical protein